MWITVHRKNPKNPPVKKLYTVSEKLNKRTFSTLKSTPYPGTTFSMYSGDGDILNHAMPSCMIPQGSTFYIISRDDILKQSGTTLYTKPGTLF